MSPRRLPAVALASGLSNLNSHARGVPRQDKKYSLPLFMSKCTTTPSSGANFGESFVLRCIRVKLTLKTGSSLEFSHIAVSNILIPFCRWDSMLPVRTLILQLSLHFAFIPTMATPLLIASLSLLHSARNMLEHRRYDVSGLVTLWRYGTAS